MCAAALPFPFDFWQYLQQEPRDILLYGMGNGADKLLCAMDTHGVRAAGIFASNGFVRGHSFHGMRVLSFDEVCAKYPKDGCVVLLAFGSSRPEVLALFDQVAARYPLFAPDLPLCGEALFDATFYCAHQTELQRARSLFCTQESRQLFDRVIACKYTAHYNAFAKAVSEKTAWDLLPTHAITSMGDFGAYNGDSAREAMRLCPELRYILAAEPDRRNFKKLSAWSECVQGCEIDCRPVAVFDRAGTAAFDDSGNRNAGLCTGRTHAQVTTDTPDALFAGRRVDYIKYDVEGAEAAALRGTAETLRRWRPALRVALYHRSEDLFSLPLLLWELLPNAYDLHLVRLPGVPCWDLDLVALPKH